MEFKRQRSVLYEQQPDQENAKMAEEAPQIEESPTQEDPKPQEQEKVAGLLQ